MTNISKKVAFSIALLLISQMVFAGGKIGQIKGSNKSQKATPYRAQKPIVRYKTRKPKPHYNYNKPKVYSSSRRYDYYRPGYKTHYLPHGHRRVYYNNVEYYFFDGYFYQPYHNDYHIVDGPIGAIVLSLPRLHFALQWNGLDYFLAGNTYYRHHPDGYIIVRNPGFRDRY